MFNEKVLFLAYHEGIYRGDGDGIRILKLY